ncbi:PREDICTED: THAP domain-containing protein 1-like, partial [Wasmannia auropunctata]|uniref:THAP domain-containing protein 1-like n=1 Tax=Wasmannia auropunctata TaxID=64793 RepID=UPI0005EE93F5
MVRTCCVPGCKSNVKSVPSHRFPKDSHKAITWLQAIKRTDLINASLQTLNNLRICTLHFTDDCIVSYAARRILKDWALPSLQLPFIITEQDRASTSSNIIFNLENIDVQNNSTPQVLSTVIEQDRANIINLENIDIQHNPIVMSVPKQINANKSMQLASQCKQLNVQSSVSIQIRQKLRQVKKQLYKKKIQIYKQRKQINKLRKRDKWEEVVTDFSSAQRTFLDMIKTNLKRKPE